MAADHKKRFEGWLAEELRSGGVPEPALAARQVMILLEGAIAQMLIHRDVAYSQAAGQAAAVIVATALSGAPVAVDRAAADRGAADRVAPRVA